MNNQDVMDRIKSSFCSLTHFKIRANALEVITAYSTINSRFVSIFVTFTKNKIVVTDSGWIDQNYYETPLYEDSEDVVRRIIESYKSSFNVKSTLDKEGVEYYYKSCENIDQISSAVFDMANFTVGVINARCLQYKDDKDEKERESFRRDANDFLKVHYADSAILRTSLDDFKSIKFNAIITKNSNLYLLMYVTGSTQRYFENDLRKSIVNFEIASKSKYRDVIKERITILNDTSEGYQPDKSSYIFELLREKVTKEPVRWTEKQRITQLI